MPPTNETIVECGERLFVLCWTVGDRMGAVVCGGGVGLRPLLHTYYNQGKVLPSFVCWVYFAVQGSLLQKTSSLPNPFYLNLTFSVINCNS